MEKNKEVATTTVKSLLSNEQIKNRFRELLKENAESFISSIISATSTNPDLAKCEPNSVISAAVLAATLNLPINQNLGFAHIVPYSGKATFQMGWKGFVQLAMRTGQYKTISAIPIYAGQLKSFNPLTNEYDWDFKVEQSGDPIGYAAYFKMLNGMEKTIFWNVAKVRAHGKKYSASFDKSFSQWNKNFDAMAIKTVVKNLLSQWGILSIEMQKAVDSDAAIINEDGSLNYPDNPTITDIPFTESQEVHVTTHEIVNVNQVSMPNASDL